MSEVPLGAHVSVGVDVEEVVRFVDGTDVDDLFTDEERTHAAGGTRAERLTGTWCAKEATVKALWPWVRLDPRRVTVERSSDGRPTVRVTAWDARATGVQVQVSISHTGTVAMAVAVAWGPPPASIDAEGAAR